ncbi:hypothetical protein [Bacillus methanolicus]|nr:hypothetical protein [Bacillus methanolicus]
MGANLPPYLCFFKGRKPDNLFQTSNLLNNSIPFSLSIELPQCFKEEIFRLCFQPGGIRRMFDKPPPRQLIRTFSGLVLALLKYFLTAHLSIFE